MLARGRAALAVHWRYHETVTGTHGSEELSYDPSRPAGERWAVLRVNGGKPSANDRKRLAARAAQVAKRGGHTALTRGGWLSESEYRLVQTTDKQLVYQLQPQVRSAHSSAVRSLLKHLSGRFVVARSDHRPLVLTLENFESFSPRFGVTVHGFRFQATFGRIGGAGGPVTVTQTSSEVRGKVFWVKGFAAKTRVELSDFTPVPMSSSTAAPATSGGS